MSNVLEFYLKMKDMMSSGLLKVAATSKTTFSKVKDHVQDVIRKNKELEDSFDKVERKLRNSGNNVGGYIRKLGLGLSLAGALSFAGSSAKAAMDYGATKTSFGVLTGSKQRGNDLANELNSLQQNTILGPEVFKAAQTMMSFGVATEKVVDITKQLGDVSMGNTDKFNALSLAYSQTQAAGRLMGQDLLQYINAGFNPLQTMSERWKEFGFQQKQSVGQLKDMMEKGKISAEMVAKAFELATGKGGKFNNMMDAIAQTSYGKMQILQGQFENFKIALGEGLMPAANVFMEMGNGLLRFLNISKTVPEVLQGERMEINTLVGSITKLNEGNSFRTKLMETLKSKYPDLFANLDIENTKNTKLLATLKDINAAYDQKIGLASQDLIANTAKEDIQDKLSFATRINTQNEYNKTAGKQGIMDSFFPKYMSILDKYKMELGEYSDVYKKGGIPAVVAQVQNDVQKLQGTMVGALDVKSKMENGQLLSEISGGISNKTMMTSKFGKNGSDKFLELFNAIYEKHTAGTAGAGDYDTLRKAWKGKTTAADINTTVDSEGKIKKNSGTVGSSVVSGGPRVINVHLGKFFDNLTINTTSLGVGLDEVEEKVTDVFLRILNSGASVQ